MMNLSFGIIFFFVKKIGPIRQKGPIRHIGKGPIRHIGQIRHMDKYAMRRIGPI